MRVILIKDCKEGKKDDIVEVSSGYATNFLIRKKFALPLNQKTEHILKKGIANDAEIESKKIEVANKIKNKIESLSLSFILKTSNLVVHGSISKKQVVKKLLSKGIKIESHSIENIKINTLGITKIKIKVYKSVEAILKVEVKNEG